MGIACLIISIVALVSLVLSIGLWNCVSYTLDTILFWMALALGILAFVFGIIPIVQKKKSAVTIAGFVISILVLLAVVFLILYLDIGIHPL